MYEERKQEVDAMFTTAQYLIQEDELSLRMREYINSRKQEAMSPQARQEALDALRRMGVVDENGKPKEEIVSWE